MQIVPGHLVGHRFWDVGHLSSPSDLSSDFNDRAVNATSQAIPERVFNQSGQAIDRVFVQSDLIQDNLLPSMLLGKIALAADSTTYRFHERQIDYNHSMQQCPETGPF